MDQQPPNFDSAINVKPSDPYFLRTPLNAAFDGSAFHYPVFRLLRRFLGLDGQIESGHDLPPTFLKAWNRMLISNDFLNVNNNGTTLGNENSIDPRHFFGTTNHDVFRWPSIKDGTQKGVLALFVTTMLFPGIPLLYYGEEQDLYLYDSSSSALRFGRQPMFSNQAWQVAGCNKMKDDQFPTLELLSVSISYHLPQFGLC